MTTRPVLDSEKTERLEAACQEALALVGLKGKDGAVALATVAYRLLFAHAPALAGIEIDYATNTLALSPQIGEWLKSQGVLDHPRRRKEAAMTDDANDRAVRAANRAEERLTRLPPDTPKEVRLGQYQAEMNFWMQPEAVYEGGIPMIFVYPSGDEKALPRIGPVPDDVDGPDVPRYLWHLLCTQDARMTMYTATSRSGCLLAVVVTKKVIYDMRCAILRSGGGWDLGDWSVRTHYAKE
jgi:hypothetical protein